ncbi:MAG: LysE family translocator [Rhizobiaceae bacterium]
MIEWSGLTATLAAFFIVAVSPGPATLAVSTVSAASGQRAGLAFGMGLGFGLAFWGIVAATGLGAVLQASAQWLMALKIAGGVYLLWLAYGSARSALRNGEGPHEAGSDEPAGRGRDFVRGLLLNLSNPKAVIAWMAALSVGLGADGGLGTVAFATGGCMALGFAIYAAYAVAFSRAPVMNGYQRIRRWVDGIVSALFAAAGLSLLRTALPGD